MRQGTRLAGLIVALVVAIGLTACAIGMIQGPIFVRQQTDSDCAVAAVAMLARTSYAKVDILRQGLGIPLDIQQGATPEDLIALAYAAGKHVRVEKTFNAVTDAGIIVARLKSDRSRGHAIYLERGLAYDPMRFGPEPWVSIAKEFEPVCFLKKV